MEDPRRVEEGLGHTPLVHEDHKDGFSEKEGKTDGGDRIDNEKEVSSAVWDQPVEEKEEEQSLVVKQKSKRVATLDAFRGLTIVVMILVDDAGGAYSRIDHSPWNGCTLADFVMPFFLFIVGVAIALALKLCRAPLKQSVVIGYKSAAVSTASVYVSSLSAIGAIVARPLQLLQQKIPKMQDAIKKIIIRTLKLLFWGILLQGGYSHAPDDLSYGVDMKHIRWCGILQRIAVVYMIVALIEVVTTKRRPTVPELDHLSIFTAYKYQWIGGFIAFLVYMITTFTLYVPDWSFVVYTQNESNRYTVECGMRGHLGPACNAVGYVDREVWGINRLYSTPVWQRLKACTLSSPNSGPFRENAPYWCRAPFEPEGLLSTISAILSGTIGIHYGHVLIHFKGHSERLKQWLSMGLGLLIIAIILHFTDAIPINKQLYSFSYVCFTAGAAGIVFCGFYLLIDVWGWRTPFLFLEWIGMNAMLVFVLGAQGILAGFVNGWYYKSPDNTLVYWIQTHVFNDVWHSERLGTLLYVIFAEITFWGVVAGILHKLRIYWKL